MYCLITNNTWSDIANLIEYEWKIQQFQAQFQQLSTTVISSDVFKGLIDSGTGFLNILTQIIDVGGGIPAVLGTIGGVSFFKNLDWIY